MSTRLDAKRTREEMGERGRGEAFLRLHPSPVFATIVRMNTLPRPEYPRPQFTRPTWLCLNGAWQFEIDSGDSGKERGWVEKEKLAAEIVVPFCPESELSGIGYTDFMTAVWYRREVEIPAEWAAFPRLRLHFQACDYDTTVWVNGQEVVRHRGGFTPFFAEIGSLVKAGEKATIVVRARDYTATRPQPGGKQQNYQYGNAGCHYTRTTGIWQTVWLEPLPASAFERPRITPELGNCKFHVELPLSGPATGLRVEAVLRDKEGEVARVSVPADQDFSPSLDLVIPEDRLHLWEPGAAYLYDVELLLLAADGTVVDRAESYAGMRSVTFRGKAVLINGKSVFQRQVLDQGYYRSGIMTAPTDAALECDILLSMAVGFNSARLHQKVFEERFLYHADRHGYLVWGEFGDWGVRTGLERVSAASHQPFAALMAQWNEALARDYNHPSIIGWCPLNETMQDLTDHIEALDDMTWGLYAATKNADRTRPVVDASGYSHRQRGADVYDCHNYEQDPVVFRGQFAKASENEVCINRAGRDYRTEISVPYAGQPYFVSEFGGIRWAPDQENNAASWGYGNAPKTIEEFYARFEGLCDALLENPDVFGYCYTQLTDVFQEQNGLYTFDRLSKFDSKRLRAIQSKPAAIEQ